MTRKEFERLRMSIEEQEFFGNFTNPIEYGIERAAFEKKKLQKLIAAAHRLSFKTTRAKEKQWRRQLERAEHSYERFKGLMKDIEAAKLHIHSAPQSTPPNRVRI